jgi:hypothetical protein
MLIRRRRWRSAGVAWALALAAIAPACRKDDDAPPTTGSGSTDPKDPGAPKSYDSKPPPVALGKLGPTPAELASAEDLSMLPVDAEAVMGINFAKLQTSEAWKQLIEPRLSGNATLLAKLTELKSTCGFDPMAEIKSLAVGMKGGFGSPDGVVVVHGLDKAKTMACFEKKDAFAKHDVDATLDGDVAILKPAKGGDPEQVAGVTFVNDTTAVVVLGPRATKDGVNKAAAGKSMLKSSPTFIDMYNRLDTGQAMWVMVNGNSKLFERLKQLGIATMGMFGTLGTADGLALDLRLRMESADNAATTKSRWAGTIEGFLKQYVDRIAISTEGADVRLVLGAAPGKLDGIKSLIK